MTAGLWASVLPASCQLPASYFAERFCNLDGRGTLIVDASSKWGFFVTVITLSHDLINGTDDPQWNTTADRPVIVRANAWICSGAWLYNCEIGEGAVVAMGTVVRSQIVAPHVMVAGNPAQVIARFVDGQWHYKRRDRMLV